MDSISHRGRRRFLRSAASVLALASASSLPRAARGQAQLGMRLEWQAFRNTPGYTAFIDAIGRMRANPDVNDPNSLAYWANAHAQYCPHSRPYFLAWHRGFLALFEQRLQALSGNQGLMLPYWDFYQSPMLPSEFIDSATGNPLYTTRANVSIRNALSLWPFLPDIVNFGSGADQAFETVIEYVPHNASHNLIGGQMITMTAPLDPIFWVFHGNIDRLWHAWAYPTGKSMPWSDDPYWPGNHQYAVDLFLPRDRTRHPARLGYDYGDISEPTALPPVSAARAMKVNARAGAAQGRPPLIRPERSAPRLISASVKSVGGCKSFALRTESISAAITLDATHRGALQQLRRALADGVSMPHASRYRSAVLVLDDIGLINLGAFGGFFYQLYLNLPEAGSPDRDAHCLGTVGPVEIASALHHGRKQLRFPASHALARLAPEDLAELVVSFVRVSGSSHPAGEAIAVGELRLELSTEEPWTRRARTPAPPGECYC
jgi:tyrosinase